MSERPDASAGCPESGGSEGAGQHRQLPDHLQGGRVIRGQVGEGQRSGPGDPRPPGSARLILAAAGRFLRRLRSSPLVSGRPGHLPPISPLNLRRRGVRSGGRGEVGGCGRRRDGPLRGRVRRAGRPRPGGGGAPGGGGPGPAGRPLHRARRSLARQPGPDERGGRGRPARSRRGLCPAPGPGAQAGDRGRGRHRQPHRPGAILG